MTLSRRQIETWDPSGLTAIGEGWLSLGAAVEKLFNRYAESVGRVNGVHWDGKAAEAAQRRADADKKTAYEMVDALQRAAERTKQGYFDVSVPLQKARGELHAAVRGCFDVSDDLVVSPGQKAPPERVTAAQQLQSQLRAAADAAQAADKAVAEALRTAQIELRAVFTAAGSLGGEQGQQDAAALLGDPSKLNPEQLRRLIEAGRLTPEQLRALQLGDKNVLATIPASQMEYLNKLARALDGKNPQEIKALMDKLPSDEAKKAFANSLQIISNNRVAVSVAGDPDVPTRGGMPLLPAKMRESLTRGDLASIKTTRMDGSAYSFIEGQLNGVRDNQAIAGIVGAGDGQYKAGSDLNRGLMEVGRRYLDTQVAFEQNPNSKLGVLTIDGRGAGGEKNITESIFQAVGDDKITVRDAVTAPGTGRDLVKDVLMHNWTDDGKAASTMFHFEANDATVEDRGDPLDKAKAERTGNIMQAVALAASSDDAWNQMRDVPGTDKDSVGKLNPILIQEVARSMSPYAGDLAGVYDNPNDPLAREHNAYKPGFDNPTDNTGWITSDANGRVNYDGARNVFALMNTDKDASSIFAGGALAEMVVNEGRYADNPRADAAERFLANAGRIEGLLDRGGTMALQDQYNDDAAHAKEAYERKAAGVKAAKEILSTTISDVVPGGKYVNTLLNAANMEKLIVGEPPEAAKQALPLGYNDIGRNWNALKAVDVLHGISPELQRQAVYHDFFDAQGKLKPLSEIPPGARDQLKNLLNMVGRADDGSDAAAGQDAYGKVVGWTRR